MRARGERDVTTIVDDHSCRRRGIDESPREPGKRRAFQITLPQLDQIDSGPGRFGGLGDEPVHLDLQTLARRQAAAIGDEADDRGRGFHEFCDHGLYGHGIVCGGSTAATPRGPRVDANVRLEDSRAI